MASEIDIEKTRDEARAILDKFGKELKGVKISQFSIFDRSDTGVRDEKVGESCDEKFRTIMFKNAPKSDEECLILEKGAWN